MEKENESSRNDVIDSLLDMGNPLYCLCLLTSVQIVSW